MRLTLARKGVAAMRDSSVLDAPRVRRVLAKLDPADRRAALRGLVLLAGAAQDVMREARRA